MTKGNTVKTKANVYNIQRDMIFCTTKNAHILQLTLSTGHSQGGEEGVNWPIRDFELDLKTTRTKELYTPKITE